MSQTYDSNTYADDHVYSADLQTIKDNFAAIRSSFSGSSAPSAVAGQLWYSTDSSNKGLFVRNNSSAWLKALTGDSSQIMYAYRNSTCEGWVLYTATGGDILLAVKGGSTYTTGGYVQGTWTQPTNTWDMGSATADVNMQTGMGTDVATDGHKHNMSAGAGAGAWRIRAAVGILCQPDF